MLPALGGKLNSTSPTLRSARAAAAQIDQLGDAGGQRIGPLEMRLHVVGLLAAGLPRAAAEDHRAGGAVQLRQRHHHGGLDRQQAAIGVFPLVQRLELDRGHREVGHVQPDQHLLGGPGVVVGRAADQREAGERDHALDHRLPGGEEVLLDRRPRVEAGGEGRDHAQAAGLHGGDHAVIVRGVARQQVGAHQQQADRAAAAALGQRLGALADAARQTRVIDADLRVLDRRGRLGGTAQHPARAIGVAIDQKLDHADDVVRRAGQPVLQRQEVGAHVLGGARDEAQDLGQPAQHLHLLGTGTRVRVAVLLALAAA